MWLYQHCTVSGAKDACAMKISQHQHSNKLYRPDAGRGSHLPNQVWFGVKLPAESRAYAVADSDTTIPVAANHKPFFCRSDSPDPQNNAPKRHGAL
jgi:hypothetical protein